MGFVEEAGPVQKVILHENTNGTPQYAIVVFKEVNSWMCVMLDYSRYQLGFDILIHSSSIVTCPSSDLSLTKLPNSCYAPRQIGYEKKYAQKLRCYGARVFENNNYKNDTIVTPATTVSSTTPSQDDWNPFKSPLKSPITSCEFLKFNPII
uniref:Uncharacterized protein n=1 Tax=Onchocerca volvulus TaxID=6282 RepID=A0A8R1TZV6_ONCVO